MVQQEVKKKTRLYGTVAALSAIVLVALIFVFGSTPGLTPVQPGTPLSVSAMKTFTSYEELKSYLTTNAAGTNSAYKGGPLDVQFFGGRSELSTAPDTVGFADPTYSITNLQVPGVDHANTEKTHGTH